MFFPHLGSNGNHAWYLVPHKSSIAQKSLPFLVVFPETGRPDEALTKFLPARVTLQKGLVGHGPACTNHYIEEPLQDEARTSCLICTASPTSKNTIQEDPKKRISKNLTNLRTWWSARELGCRMKFDLILPNSV